jgi:uncharacterized CHY-type Zn-finger protein
MSFINAKQRPITKWDISEFWNKPILTCSYCQEGLKMGDYVDHLFPFFSTHNQCQKCREKSNTRNSIRTPMETR